MKMKSVIASEVRPAPPAQGPRMALICGTTPEASVLRRKMSAYPPSEATPSWIENQWLNRDGTLRRIAWSATALTDAQGRVAFIIATGIDVTIQRAARSTLREGEARYRQPRRRLAGFGLHARSARQDSARSTRMVPERVATVDDMTGQPRGVHRAGQQDAVPVYLKKIGETGEAQGCCICPDFDGELRVVAYRNKLIMVPGARTLCSVIRRRHQRAGARGGQTAHADQSDSILASVGGWRSSGLILRAG